IFLGPGLVFGCRTSDARYAKCSVWKELLGSRIYLAFETYAGPSFSLSLEAFIDTTAQTVVERGEESCVRVVMPPAFGIDDFRSQFARFGGPIQIGDSSPEPVPWRPLLATTQRPGPLVPTPLFPTTQHECAGLEIVHADE